MNMPQGLRLQEGDWNYNRRIEQHPTIILEKVRNSTTGKNSVRAGKDISNGKKGKQEKCKQESST